MSIDGWTVSRTAARGVTWLSLAAVTATASWAAEVDFRPVLTFGLFHDGNVAITGENGQGDEAAALAIDLTVDRKTANSQLSFTYEPGYVAYRQSTDLDYLAQLVRLNYVLTPTRQAVYTFDVDATRTDRQGVRLTDPSNAVTFVPRSTQTHVNAYIRGDHNGRRNLISWELRGGLDDFSQPKSAGITPPATCVEDADCDDGDSCTLDSCIAGQCQFATNANCQLSNSVGAGGRASWRYALSERSSIGLGLDVTLITYDVLPTSYVESFGLVGAHTFSRATNITYTAGAAYAGASGDSVTEFIGDVTLSRTVADVSTLSAGVRRGVSQGSGIGGVTLDDGGFAAYDYVPHHRGLRGSIAVAYWDRQPVPIGASAATASTKALSTNASIGWNFNQYVSLNAAHTYSDQTSSDSTLNTQYGSYGLYLRWAIRGDERTALRPSQRQGQPQQPEQSQ